MILQDRIPSPRELTQIFKMKPSHYHRVVNQLTISIIRNNYIRIGMQKMKNVFFSRFTNNRISFQPS